MVWVGTVYLSTWIRRAHAGNPIEPKHREAVILNGQTGNIDAEAYTELSNHAAGMS